MPIPSKLTNLLDDFADIMLDKFPKVFPPICTIDHRVVIELGLHPPTRAPYRLSGLELDELKR
jgi:hypothetical protein